MKRGRSKKISIPKYTERIVNVSDCRKEAREREEYAKKEAARLAQEQAIRNAKIAPWCQSSSSQGLSLQEIQKLEKEKARQEALILQQQRQMQELQQQQEKAAASFTWAAKAKEQRQVKSLAEIQAEEQERLAKVSYRSSTIDFCDHLFSKAEKPIVDHLYSNFFFCSKQQKPNCWLCRRKRNNHLCTTPAIFGIPKIFPGLLMYRLHGRTIIIIVSVFFFFQYLGFRVFNQTS